MMLEIKIVADGPFYFKGSFTYIDEQMTCRHMAGDSVVFCRCGRTNRAPFCDQSHNSFFFNTHDQLERKYAVSGKLTNQEGGEVVVAAIQNGPMHISGAVSLVDDSGVTWRGTQVKLCRCGLSQIKPFCDGTHKKTNRLNQ